MQEDDLEIGREVRTPKAQLPDPKPQVLSPQLMRCKEMTASSREVAARRRCPLVVPMRARH